MTLVSEARAATGLTQREFAAIIGVDPAQIGHWASGKKRMTKAVTSLMVVIKELPAESVEILAAHHGVLEPLKAKIALLKAEVSADPARVPREFSPAPAGDRDEAVIEEVEGAVIEEVEEDEGCDEFFQTPSGYLVFPDRGINPSLEEPEEEPPPPAEEDDDAGFAGDGGPPPGRAPADEDERTYGPNRRGDRGKRRAVDEQVPDYTPEFGYTGPQEPPGGGP